MCENFIPEDQLTENQRNFIGETFTTPKGGILTVTGFLGTNKHRNAIFACHCSICSQDEEMWPLGSMTSTKNQLKAGSFPCGCCGALKQKRQLILEINRYLLKTDSNLTATEAITEKGVTKYICTCRVCSEDEELWPYGSIRDTKDHLMSGRVNCGCNKHGSFTDRQYDIKMGRLCKDRGYSILKADGSGINRLYTLHCNICSRDKELWTEGTIVCKYRHFKKGTTPCGCGKPVNWTEEQNKVRVKRKCSELGFVFHGWADEYNGASTHINLYNPETGNQWNSSTITSLFVNGGDPYKSGQGLNDAQIIDQFMTVGNFLEGTYFWRSHKSYSKKEEPYWNYTCPRCSKDEYVQAGVCSGVFTCRQTSLKSGSKACRCSKGYKPTSKQRLYDINIALQGKGEFIKLYKEKGLYYVKWKCIKCGDIREQNMEGLLKGFGCGSCAKTGFNPNKPAYLYIVRWYGYCESFLKFGKTNREVIDRVSQQDGRSKHLDYEVLYSFSDPLGSKVSACESHIKTTLDTHVCPRDWLPDGWTETVEDTEVNIYKMLELVKLHLKPS